jgi:hypothetical protein
VTASSAGFRIVPCSPLQEQFQKRAIVISGGTANIDLSTLKNVGIATKIYVRGHFKWNVLSTTPPAANTPYVFNATDHSNSTTPTDSSGAFTMTANPQ